MLVQYRNRKNVVINGLAWARLFRSASYSQIAYDDLGEIIIDTSWVGVFVPEVEKRAGLFLTQVIPAEFAEDTKKGRVPKKRPKLARDIWSETEEEAIEAHYRRVKEFQ